jgi:hypothetical protein
VSGPVSIGPLRIAWLYVSSPVASGVHSTEVSPVVSTAVKYGWIIAVRPAPVSRRTWTAARSVSAGRR